jgi:NAD(P)-dependent dehydrogenase (short-subunit alcohol dehydrogenase family)
MGGGTGDGLVGRVALVTGASRGIGQAVAARFAAEGAVVAVTARTVHAGEHRLAGSLDETVALVEAVGGRVLAVPADLADPAARSELVERVEGELGPVDVLVNNAAVTYVVPFEDFTDRRFDLMVDVQVRAPFDLAQRVLPGMRERRTGWILNISSGAAQHPQGPPYSGARGWVVYGMVKAALERFTTGLASEVWADGIAVNCLSPSGLVLTPGTQEHRLDQLVPVERQEPMEDFVEAAFRLCTGDPAVVTGRVQHTRQALGPDGGPRLTEL